MIHYFEISIKWGLTEILPDFAKITVSIGLLVS